MNEETSIVVQHRNCLTTYLSDWMTMMRHVLININPELAQRYDLKKLPTTFESLQNNNYDLSVVLTHLDSRLRVLEEKSISQLDLQAYAEARVFLKAFYVFFCILLDDVSGVIEFFYKKNEPGVAVTKSFGDILKNSESGKLPSDLSKILETSSSWFPEIRDSRDDLVHHYDSHLISIERIEGGRTILGHFNIKGRARRKHVSIREHFGFLLREYQTLIDNLLDHFDTKFRDWYGIVQGQSGRNLTIMQGCVAFPLWWVQKYGNYRHRDLHVSESV